MYKIKFVMNLFRLIPSWIMVKASSDFDVIKKDINIYMLRDGLRSDMFHSYCWLMLQKPEFVSQIIYRLKKQSRVSSTFLSLLFRGQCALFIGTDDIGEGLYIQHGFSTIIAAKRIGKNCFINQQVTIGYEGEFNPIIGDNVRICSGAKVIGNVEIGDNSIVGANAVIIHDIPPNEVWGGVPGKCIKKIKVDE